MKKLWTSLEKNKPNITSNPVSTVNRGMQDRDAHLDEVFDNKTLDAHASRRDFLKLFGFSIASAAVAASCEQPIRKAIPYLIRPEEITPGKANFYASTFADESDYCAILVKVRDGRPIKIEGNELSSVTQGGTSARVQASVLNLYDDARYKSPSKNGKETTWTNLDEEIIAKLKEINSKGKTIALLTPSVISPATHSIVKQFTIKYSVAQHIQYDAVSYSGIIEANKLAFDKAVVPSYHFDKAEVVVSFGADFLGTWLSPVEFTRQYSKKRSLTEGQKKLSQHIQLEANLSLTGSNADERILLKPSQEKIVLANLYNAIATRLGKSGFNCPESPIAIDTIAGKLLAQRGKSLVLCGSNNTESQIIVNGINKLLGNYKTTIDLNNPLMNKQGIDAEMEDFIESLKADKIGGVIFWDVNPLYDHPKSFVIKNALKKIDLSVSLTSAHSETAETVEYVAPVHHYLESWNDSEIKPGKYSLTQPCIHPIFNTRQAQESLLTWAGAKDDYQNYLKKYWEKNLFTKSGKPDFFSFWNSCLHDGVYETKTNAISDHSISSPALEKAFSGFTYKKATYELILYEKVGIGSGKYANNPWLQEMPDPITKATWDNYLCVSPTDAELNRWSDGDLLSIDGNVTLPVIVQPGQAPGTMSAALGYGRTHAGKVAQGVGKNLAPLIQKSGTNRSYVYLADNITRTGSGYVLARTQTHHSMEGRAIIREASINDYLKNPAAGNEKHEEVEKLHTTIYKKHEFKGHHWGMAIDLNKCTGCSACLISCSAENNVPVVGKKEVQRVHEMHWIRIDRYFEGDPENPKTYRQPVMCQHCDNAPCENVCPVAATNHSDEGINQMAYNRCIGTRYCNNNCPYKVRRFNWFDYTQADAFKGNTVDPAGMTLDLKRMVLNPDVTVRAKGVIEKCSLCVQRIQEKKLTAKLENRPLADGEIKTACQQACPAEAIIFGDLNDKNSKVSKLFGDQRNYHLLEELHTLPSVGYLTKITNREENDKKV